MYFWLLHNRMEKCTEANPFVGAMGTGAGTALESGHLCIVALSSDEQVTKCDIYQLQMAYSLPIFN